MSGQKSVKLLVFVLVLALAGVLAFGAFPSEDSQGKLKHLQKDDYTATHT